jgi:hypothetical protein
VRHAAAARFCDGDVRSTLLKDSSLDYGMIKSDCRHNSSKVQVTKRTKARLKQHSNKRISASYSLAHRHCSAGTLRTCASRAQSMQGSLQSLAAPFARRRICASDSSAVSAILPCRRAAVLSAVR